MKECEIGHTGQPTRARERPDCPFFLDLADVTGGLHLPPDVGPRGGLPAARAGDRGCADRDVRADRQLGLVKAERIFPVPYYSADYMGLDETFQLHARSYET